MLYLQETFVGEKTGVINVSALRSWCVKVKRKPEKFGFTLPNTAELITAHDFDDTAKSRLEYLMNNPVDLMKPLLLATWDDTRGVYILDGWHRLLVFYKCAMQLEANVVPFLALKVTQQEAERFSLSVLNHNNRKIN